MKNCITPTALGAQESRIEARYSSLLELDYVDIVGFSVIDPMHNLFLGTAKSYFKNILVERGILSQAALQQLHGRVESMTVPGNLGKLPRKIASSFSTFTADEWKNWTIAYSLPALQGIIPSDDYSCWRSFVLACQAITTPMIKQLDITKADALFLQFCSHFEEQYGTDTVTPNMHLHCHLANCLKDYGSIYGFWLFSFERYNGILGNYQTNKRSVEIQLMRRFLRDTDILNHLPPGDFTEIFQETLSSLRVSTQEIEPVEFSGIKSLLEAATCPLGSHTRNWGMDKYVTACSWSSIGTFDCEELQFLYETYMECSIFRTLNKLQLHFTNMSMPL